MMGSGRVTVTVIGAGSNQKMGHIENEGKSATWKAPKAGPVRYFGIISVKRMGLDNDVDNKESYWYNLQRNQTKPYIGHYLFAFSVSLHFNCFLQPILPISKSYFYYFNFYYPIQTI